MWSPGRVFSASSFIYLFIFVKRCILFYYAVYLYWDRLLTLDADILEDSIASWTFFILLVSIITFFYFFCSEVFVSHFLTNLWISLLCYGRSFVIWNFACNSLNNFLIFYSIVFIHKFLWHVLLMKMNGTRQC